MKQRRQDFVLGLTTVVFIGLFMATIMFLYPLFRTPGQRIEIQFRLEDGMAPIKQGSPVILGGSLEVGRVRSVQLAHSPGPAMEGGRSGLVFLVETDIQEDLGIWGNCQITTDQPPIGGAGSVVILNVGTPGVKLVQPVIGLPPQSLSAAIGQLSRRLLGEGGMVEHLTQATDPTVEGSIFYKVLASLNDLNAMTQQMRVQMSPSEQLSMMSKVHELLDDLNAATAALRAQLVDGDEAAALEKTHLALDRLQEALAEAGGLIKEGRPLIVDTLTSMAHAARTVDRELLVSLREELDATSATSLTGKIHKAMDAVNGSLADVQEMTAEGQRFIALNRPSLEKTLANFQGMSEQLRLASQEVLLNPSKLLWGPGPQREEQLLVFQAARSFAEAASQLDDAASRLEAVLRTLPADGRPSATNREELRAISDGVRAAFERFQRAEQALWKQLE